MIDVEVADHRRHLRALVLAQLELEPLRALAHQLLQPAAHVDVEDAKVGRRADLRAAPVVGHPDSLMGLDHAARHAQTEAHAGLGVEPLEHVDQLLDFHASWGSVFAVSRMACWISRHGTSWGRRSQRAAIAAAVPAASPMATALPVTR